MPFVRGFLRVVRRGGGHPDQGLPGVDPPVDPDYGIEEGHPDHGLPGWEGPVDPGYGIGIERPGHGLPKPPRPVDPGFGIPLPPIIDNGLPGAPPVIDNGLPVRPTYPVRPDNSLPRPPTAWPKPPITTWPPPAPVYPSHPIYPTPGGERPDNTLPGGTPPVVDNTLPGNQPEVSPPIYLPPGAVWPPLPGIEGKVIALVWIVGYGYRWASLDPGMSNPIAPTPQPKG
jgi:hypothetical protein